MNSNTIINKLIHSIVLMSAMAFAYAAKPVWTFTPLSPTAITVSAGETATVSYRVTNQSKRTHTLAMSTIQGITQDTTPGNCSSPFVLSYQESCNLTLTINGNLLTGPILGGPIVCSGGNPNQCYQPSPANSLHITQSSINNFTIGGSVFGLLGTVVLQNNGGDALTLTADGTFTFPNTLNTGASYSVTIQTQPATQTCTVSNGSGTITSVNITNIVVNCSVNTRTVGGTISGLALSESVVLQNNGGDNLTVTSNGSFTFPTSVAQGSNYNVTILSQPATQFCTVSSGSGVVGNSNITSVLVTCATNSFTVGGSVTGLSGTVVLQNNGADSLSLNSNGSFTFPTPVAQGAPYAVTVLTQPAAQTCTVTNGSGIMGGANVTNVSVTCILNTTLSISLTDLALSVTGLTEYGVSGTPLSGLPRIITITNTGAAPAQNVATIIPTWPSGTSSVSTCTGTLLPGNNCTITITPGNTSSSDGTNPCSATQPVPGIVQITSNNASTVSANVVVLTYGCIYQGGYVFAFDDTTANSTSVGGKVASTVDQATPNGIIWSSNGNGGISSDASFDAIFGISEISTTSSPDPSTGQVPGQIACNGATNGLCDTNNIYVYYQNNATNAPINLSFYAVGMCKQVISGYSDWYLPAICELGFDGQNFGSGCGTMVAPTLQNMQSSLVLFNNLNLLSQIYWSSTQFSSTVFAWDQNFTLASQTPGLKSNQFPVRCTRVLT